MLLIFLIVGSIRTSTDYIGCFANLDHALRCLHLELLWESDVVGS